MEGWGAKATVPCGCAGAMLPIETMLPTGRYGGGAAELQGSRAQAAVSTLERAELQSASILNLI